MNQDFECPRCGHCCLQQTEQEPVAYVSSLDFDDDDQEIIPAKDKGKLGTSNCDIPLYTSPPKRGWVGLTADEIWQCNKAKSGSAVEFHICSAHQNVEDFAEAIEAKLKEKNT